MTYLLLNTAFLLAIGVGLAIFTKQRPRKTLLYTLVILIVMTLVFDSIFIILGIFEYNPENILGLHLWKAPIEDFAYTIASVAMIGLIWECYEAKTTDA